ncbi:hypothetical protein HPP92_028472 [Vanilla planifolia]|uniref:Uncharacterized protein n=1 Tax=Vanilla planifolia TaxID=51239 RepID=A0A835PAU1_VANPL|nr:hypothetical protein HPP92_028472 [Vanilla planifolia]
MRQNVGGQVLGFFHKELVFLVCVNGHREGGDAIGDEIEVAAKDEEPWHSNLTDGGCEAEAQRIARGSYKDRKEVLKINTL